MSGNNYGYYYLQPPASYGEQQWNNWPVEHQQYTPDFSRPPPPLPAYSQSTHRNHGYHSVQNVPRHFLPRRRRNVNHPYNNVRERNLNMYKRPWLDSIEVLEPKSKSSKKKKKPLSQNIPSKKDWTLQDAERAILVEKEYNKRFKNHSLIIKFPDLELNKDIVSKFHPAIENVHFQQPSTARFCFVTLEKSADAETVIKELNKQKFGDGLLTAEYKKDREEEQNIGPNDIDPLTLYVGNLAQEITIDDMVNRYPKSKRIDIGYAKKMKYTRYAFVTFRNTNDSVEAFKLTHSTEMYSKSLIVRFRRLHGTVGMSGETRCQTVSTSDSDNRTVIGNDNDINHVPSPEEIETNNLTRKDSNDERDFEVGSSPVHVEDQKPIIKSDYVSPFLPGSIEVAFAHHRPIKTIKKEIKKEIKTEIDDMFEGDTNRSKLNYTATNVKVETTESSPMIIVKEEPNYDEEDEDDDEFEYSESFQNCVYEDNSDDDGTDIINRVTNLDGLYEKMSSYREKVNDLKNIVDTL